MLIVIHETKPYENLFISAYPSFSMPMSNNHHSEESRARKLVYILSGRGVLYIYIYIHTYKCVYIFIYIYMEFSGFSLEFFCPKRLIFYT